MIRIYIAQGVVVFYQGAVLIVEPQADNQPLCVGCYFNRNQSQKRGECCAGCAKHGMLCTASMRKDNHHVIFRQIRKAKV